MDKEKDVADLEEIINSYSKKAYERFMKETSDFVNHHGHYRSREDADAAHPKSIHRIIAEGIVNEGYGNVKQAVEEFAEKLKASFYNMEYSAIAIDNKIDDLITELYGVDEK